MWNRLWEISCVVSVVDRVTVSRLLLLKNANIWEAIALMWKCRNSPLLWVCEVSTPRGFKFWIFVKCGISHYYHYHWGYYFLNNCICVWTAMVVTCQICISGSYLSGQDIKADALHISRFRKYWRIFFFSFFGLQWYDLICQQSWFFKRKNAPIVKSCPPHRISQDLTHSSPREAITVTYLGFYQLSPRTNNFLVFY